MPKLRERILSILENTDDPEEIVARIMYEVDGWEGEDTAAGIDEDSLDVEDKVNVSVEFDVTTAEKLVRLHVGWEVAVMTVDEAKYLADLLIGAES